jgi:hypothetical protein
MGASQIPIGKDGERKNDNHMAELICLRQIYFIWSPHKKLTLSEDTSMTGDSITIHSALEAILRSVGCNSLLLVSGGGLLPWRSH